MIVDVSRFWTRLCKSPVHHLIFVLAGPAFSFFPLFIYWYGQGDEPLGPKWLGLPICWAGIIVCGLFYVGLGQHVAGRINQAHKPKVRQVV